MDRYASFPFSVFRPDVVVSCPDSVNAGFFVRCHAILGGKGTKGFTHSLQVLEHEPFLLGVLDNMHLQIVIIHGTENTRYKAMTPSPCSFSSLHLSILTLQAIFDANLGLCSGII